MTNPKFVKNAYRQYNEERQQFELVTYFRAHDRLFRLEVEIPEHDLGSPRVQVSNAYETPPGFQSSHAEMLDRPEDHPGDIHQISFTGKDNKYFRANGDVVMWNGKPWTGTYDR